MGGWIDSQTVGDHISLVKHLSCRLQHFASKSVSRKCWGHQGQNYRPNTSNQISVSSFLCEEPERESSGSRRGWHSAGTQLCGRPAHVCAVDWVLILIGWDPVLVVQCFQHLRRWGQSYPSPLTARPIHHIDKQHRDHNQLVLGLMITKRGRKGANWKVQRDSTFSCGQLERCVE